MRKNFRFQRVQIGALIFDMGVRYKYDTYSSSYRAKNRDYRGRLFVPRCWERLAVRTGQILVGGRSELTDNPLKKKIRLI